MPETAIILLAHGAREPEWATPLRRVFESVAAQAPDLRVDLAQEGDGRHQGEQGEDRAEERAPRVHAARR